MHRAVYNNDFNKLETLLKDGKDINERDPQQRTPLIYAAYVNNNSMLKYLIGKGAKVNEVDYKGCTALIYAGYYGDLKNVKDLIEAGADIFVRDSSNFSAYEYAVNFKFYDVADLLKSKGAEDMSKYYKKPIPKFDQN
jgi:ankyrin repeat protein